MNYSDAPSRNKTRNSDMDNGKVSTPAKGSMAKGGNTGTMKTGDSSKKSNIAGFGAGKVGVGCCDSKTVGKMPGKGSINGFSGGSIEGKV